MSRFLDRYRRPLRTILMIVVALALTRVAFGIYAIAFLSDDGFATSVRATIIFALAALVGVAFALWLRSTPRNQRRTTND